jgi:hypothetical protein
VPDAVLRRGPDDPVALDWLWAHWGTTQTLRHVADDATEAAVLRARVPAGAGGLGGPLLVGRLDAVAGAGAGRRTLADAAPRDPPKLRPAMTDTADRADATPPADAAAADWEDPPRRSWPSTASRGRSTGGWTWPARKRSIFRNCRLRR